LVLALRDEHPAWGGRKLQRRLQDLGHQPPAASTITEILRRNGRLRAPDPSRGPALQRFEHDTPNALWQMDFKGHFPLLRGRCHPLTVLDDHSRFNLVLEACADERRQTVQEHLTACFRRYGMPVAILADNGPPWGAVGASGHTKLSIWLLQVGVPLVHGRPYHPQTQGKEERYHRSLNTELLANRTFEDLCTCQEAFNCWRFVYNHERPHEALDMATPATRYTPSPRPFPEVLPLIEYDSTQEVRRVQPRGQITFKGRYLKLSKALAGHWVALEPLEEDGRYAVFFAHHRVATIDLKS
jgi:transposase InsO family protein